jgi:prepilin-type processing-associated H-X9-DG protein
MMSKYSATLGKSFAFDSEDIGRLSVFGYFDGHVAIWVSYFILCSEN